MEQNLNRIAEAELTTSAVGFGNTLLAVVSLPSEVETYIADNNLSFGKWYCGGSRPTPIQLTDFKFHSYWGWSLIFSDKTMYRCSLPFWWSEVEEPKEIIEVSTVEVDNKKERDKEYYKLKSRHELLCQKKLELMRQGKNTLMRNAYINQELELLRSKLSEYRTS